MKLATPKTVDDYFAQTEHAVKHAYRGLDFCWSFAKEAQLYEPKPTRHGDMIELYPTPTTLEEERNLRRHGELLRKYLELGLSEAMFAGFILQTAHMAISLYSQCRSVPESCRAYVDADNAQIARFCIGKERYGIPTGLIVYAGRNQYAHWDEEQYRPTNARVFDALNAAFADNIFADLAFELSNPSMNIYAREVLLIALGWRSYETYLAEMKELLRP